MVQVLPAQAETSSIQTPPAQTPLITALLKKNVFKIVTLKKSVIPNELVTPEKIPSNTQKSHPVVQAYNDIKNKNLVLIQLLTILLKYDVNWDFYIRPPPKQISLLDTSLDYIVKVIKLLHDVPESSINRFAAYYPHYKEKPGMTESTYDPFFFWPLPKLLSLPNISSDCVVKFATYYLHYKKKIVSNPTWTFVCAANYLYFSYDWSNLFLYGWNNLSIAFFFAHNNNFCAAKPGLVTKKGKPPRTFLYFSNFLQPPSLLLNSMLLKIHLVMFKYILISEYATIFNWQLSSTLAAMIIKTDYEYLTLTKHLSEKTFDLS